MGIVFLSVFRTDQDIQTYTIAVINALFLKAPEDKRQVQTKAHYSYFLMMSFLAAKLH